MDQLTAPRIFFGAAEGESRLYVLGGSQKGGIGCLLTALRILGVWDVEFRLPALYQKKRLLLFTDISPHSWDL